VEEQENVAFDLVRASVNLVLGGLLIAYGTSQQLPLSTTYVTFMVGMGSSLADRAWGRESAVYRVTGVVSVVGGWFITAGAAFILAVVVASVMYFGGLVAMFLMITLVIYLLYRSNKRYKEKQHELVADTSRVVMMESNDNEEIWCALKSHSSATMSGTLGFLAESYRRLFDSFAKDSLRPIKGTMTGIVEEKALLKKNRRLETRGMQRLEKLLAYENGTWYHLGMNSLQQMLNTLMRIAEPMKEHAEHSFTPLTAKQIDEFAPFCARIYDSLVEIEGMIASGDYGNADTVSARSKELKHELSSLRKDMIRRLNDSDGSLRIDFVYLNLVQESHELLSEVRNLLRGCRKFYV
jgi:hypothetical protein